MVNCLNEVIDCRYGNLTLHGAQRNYCYVLNRVSDAQCALCLGTSTLHDSGCTVVLASGIKASWSRQVIARYIYHPNNIGEYDSGGDQWDDAKALMTGSLCIGQSPG